MPEIQLRRIKVNNPDKPQGDVFTIAPSFVLPYMTGYTEDVEKALFLRGKFGVPYWGLTYVFGHNDMCWERLELSLGRNSLVGTAEFCPFGTGFANGATQQAAGNVPRKIQTITQWHRQRFIHNLVSRPP